MVARNFASASIEDYARYGRLALRTLWKGRKGVCVQREREEEDRREGEGEDGRERRGI